MKDDKRGIGRRMENWIPAQDVADGTEVELLDESSLDKGCASLHGVSMDPI